MYIRIFDNQDHKYYHAFPIHSSAGSIDTSKHGLFIQSVNVIQPLTFLHHGDKEQKLGHV
jgi:hypothetical protein